MTATEKAIFASLIEYPNTRVLLELIDPKHLSTDGREVLFSIKKNVSKEDVEIYAEILEKGIKVDFMDEVMTSEIATERLIREFHDSCRAKDLAALLGSLAKKVKEKQISKDEAIETVWNFEKESKTIGQIKSASDVATEYISELDAYLKGDFIGIPFPYARLNSFMNPLGGGELVIVGGQAGMGKTAYMLNLAYLWALKKIRVGFFALEMRAKELENRIHQRHFSFSLMRERKKLNIYKNEKERLDRFVEEFRKLPLFFVDSGKSSLVSVVSQAKTMKLFHDVDVIFIDYLQLLRTEESLNRDGEIGLITRTLKLLAMELDIPVIIGSQLNRRTEMNNDGRPRLSNLRESGNIEQDADIVQFVYRPFFYVNSSKETDFEVIVGKQRNGPLGTAKLYYDTERQLISEE